MYSSKSPYRYKIGTDNCLRILVIIVLAVVSSCGVFLYLLEIDFMNYLPTVSLCPFHAVTGIPCPGCGMTRAMISLGQLKLEEAIKYNLFSTPLLILMVLYVWPRKFPCFLQHKIFSIIMLVVVIFVWLMRYQLYK
jgi:hypothetical protein